METENGEKDRKGAGDISQKSPASLIFELEVSHLCIYPPGKSQSSRVNSFQYIFAPLESPAVYGGGEDKILHRLTFPGGIPYTQKMGGDHG